MPEADIVRELIGSVKPRKRADIPIHPQTKQFSINANKSFKRNTSTTLKIKATCEWDAPLRAYLFWHVF